MRGQGCGQLSVARSNFASHRIDPDLNEMQYQKTWDMLDIFFNAIFLVELLANLYGYGGPVSAFWKSPWNVFDFFIVTVGVTLMKS